MTLAEPKAQRNVLLAICLWLISLPCFAQADYQLRPLIHWQIEHLAGWSVLTDVTKHPLRTLQVAGWLSKDESGWREVMGGVLAGTDGTILPVVNLRSYSKTKRSDLYVELHLLPNRALADAFATIPVRWQTRIGVESEFLTGLDSNVKSKAGIGPRFSVRLPKTNFSVATTCFFNIKSNPAIRTYLVYNLTR